MASLMTRMCSNAAKSMKNEAERGGGKGANDTDDIKIVAGYREARGDSGRRLSRRAIIPLNVTPIHLLA